MLLGKKVIGTIAYMGGVLEVPEQFCWSWGDLREYNTEYLCAPGEMVYYWRPKASFHSFSRNQIVDNSKGDWTLMLDTDHSFEPDIAVRLVHLMNKHEVDVLTGIYQYKGHPHAPVLFMEGADGGFKVIGDWDKSVEIFQIHSSGGGCLLVKNSVYSRIKNELKENPFDIEFPFSEDHSFFRRLKKLEIKVFCAPSVEYPHLELREITLKDYDITELKFSNRIEIEGRN